MKKDLSHIFRGAVISVLLTGFLAHLLLPLSSHAQKTAFTRWLDHNVVSTGDENEIKLRNTIRQLPENTGNFFVLIQEASELVANHKEDFRLRGHLPDNSENKVTSWLVGQWNIFQHQKTGTDAILPDTTQPFQKWISSNNYLNLFSSFSDRGNLLQNSSFEILKSVKSVKAAIIPLVSGISINAP